MWEETWIAEEFFREVVFVENKSLHVFSWRSLFGHGTAAPDLFDRSLLSKWGTVFMIIESEQ